MSPEHIEEIEEKITDAFDRPPRFDGSVAGAPAEQVLTFFWEWDVCMSRSQPAFTKKVEEKETYELQEIIEMSQNCLGLKDTDEDKDGYPPAAEDAFGVGGVGAANLLASTKTA